MTDKKIVADLEADITADADFLALMLDEEFCAELWCAFANVAWQKARFPEFSVDEQVVMRLSDTKSEPVQWSFRAVARVIAEIRNAYHNTDETYMDWYCRAPLGYTYGRVSPRVLETLGRLGWEPVPDMFYLEANT